MHLPVCDQIHLKLTLNIMISFTLMHSSLFLLVLSINEANFLIFFIPHPRSLLNGATDLFDILARILQGDTLSYLMRTCCDATRPPNESTTFVILLRHSLHYNVNRHFLGRALQGYRRIVPMPHFLRPRLRCVDQPQLLI